MRQITGTTPARLMDDRRGAAANEVTLTGAAPIRALAILRELAVGQIAKGVGDTGPTVTLEVPGSGLTIDGVLGALELDATLPGRLENHIRIIKVGGA